MFNQRRPQSRPRTPWTNYIFQMAQDHVGVLLEVDEVAGERKVWASLLPPKFINGSMDGWIKLI